MDKVGQADWFDGNATDMRLANINRNKFEQGVEMAGIGYRYTLEELGQAMLVSGLNLSAERAEAASYAYESFMDKLAYLGDSNKGFTGLINNASVTIIQAAATGTGSSKLWSTKTADQMITDVQAALSGVYEGSNTVEMADTILLPVDAIQQLSIARIPNTTATALEYLSKNNLYTHVTGQTLTIRGVLGLGTAGGGGVGRMVAYRKDPARTEAARAHAAPLPARVADWPDDLRHSRHLPHRQCRDSSHAQRYDTSTASPTAPRCNST